MERLDKLNTKLSELKGSRNQVKKTLEEKIGAKRRFKRDISRHEKALEVIKIVGQKTQEQLSYNISEITSLAMESVMENPYELDIDFILKRGRTECDISFTRDDNKFKPTDTGGGAIDVAAFALRIASWSMATPRTRNTLILDEPFKLLKGEEANKRALEMVRQVSKKLGIQIIMVSDERVSREVTIDATDRLFEVSMKKGVSIVKQK
jgi:DNA repair exonuclease SbcCD ATPase subunit